MAGNLIVTTPKISMHALAYQGIMVYTCFPQIRDMLLRKFGDEFVLLFARPVENPGDGQIDWYTPVQGQARKLSELPEAERVAASQKMAHAASEILGFAEELIQKGRPQDITRGNVLKLALRYPDDDVLYAVGQQPVFTCWGFGPGTPGVEGRYLSRLGQAPTNEAVAGQTDKTAAKTFADTGAQPVQEPVKRAGASFSWGWLWWLFPLLCALLLFFLLFCRFGSIEPLSSVALFEWKDFPLQARLEGRETELARLRGELDELEKRLHGHVAMCKPESREKPEAAPPAQPLVQEKGENLEIPENAENVGFLEGEWICRTGLGNAETGEPVQFSFTFNKNGDGEGIVHEQAGACIGKARGILENGVLRINLGQQQCDKSDRVYQPINIECKNAFQHGGTICRGINMDGSSWQANFQKLR